MDEKSKKNIIILGAGATGLSAGLRFIDRKYNVILLEKADHPGGLAKTITRGEYRLDIGPHHLFSQNEDILKEIIDLFEKDELAIFNRDARLYFHDRYLDYPLTAKNVLFHMGFKNAFLCSVSYIWAVVRRFLVKQKNEETFTTWIQNNFGSYLYKIFFKPYTEQFWGIPCEDLSIDCIPLASKMSFMKTLKLIFVKKFNKESLSVGERDTTLTLYYPKKGVGEIVKKMHDSFITKGGKMELGCNLSNIACADDGSFKVYYQTKVKENIETRATHIISTIPISNLVEIMTPAAPAIITESAKKLEYLSTIVLYIVIPDRDVFDCAYLYLVDRPYNRVSNVNRFHPDLCPDNENMLALEITCHYNDNTWNGSDEELFELCIPYLEKDNFIIESEVKQYFSIRVKSAYPFYKLGYRKHLEKIREHFEKIPNLVIAGRTGAFKYMDIDQCMEDTAELANRLDKKGTL
ncbi:FAD-dependent oxidoreductase [Nitrospinae bacterium]|nr:FAD-dependent oxidoreductase [Nitrospinota bacterium]